MSFQSLLSRKWLTLVGARGDYSVLIKVILAVSEDGRLPLVQEVVGNGGQRGSPRVFA